MDVESISSSRKKDIGVIFLAEVVLFFVTIVICWLSNQLNWNSFFSTLFIVGICTCMIGAFFGRETIGSRSVRLPGNIDEPKIQLRGLASFGVIAGISGILAIVLSILIPLMFPS